jgi:4-hydroxybenzoate polyprenyltransferase
VAPVFGDAEPWCLGAVFMMFLMGATTTKDLDDIEGDTAGGVQNIAVKMGRAAAIRMVAPFFIVPWLVLPLLGWLGILTPGIGVLTTLGVILAAYGAFVVRLLFRVHEEDSTHFENHIAWRHMYGLMMVAQVGSSVIYHI